MELSHVELMEAELKIKNIPIAEFVQKEDIFFYNLVQKEIKAKNLFNKKVCKWSDLTFDEMTVVIKIVENPSIESLESLFRICYKEKDFLTCGIIDFFQAKKYIDKMILETVKRERLMTASNPDPRMISAGSDNLKKFGTLNTKIRIAEMFGFRPSKIGSWKYTEVLHIMAHNVTSDMIRQNLSTMK